MSEFEMSDPCRAPREECSGAIVLSRQPSSQLAIWKGASQTSQQDPIQRGGLSNDSLIMLGYVASLMLLLCWRRYCLKGLADQNPQRRNAMCKRSSTYRENSSIQEKRAGLFIPGLTRAQASKCRKGRMQLERQRKMKKFGR